MTTFKRTEKAVNSKPLLKELTGFIEDGITDFGIMWDSDLHRDSLIEVIDDYLMELAEGGRVTHWKVVCDSRNNKLADMDEGIYHLTVMYKQWNCLNTTQLNYVIDTKDEEEMTLDFEL
jgi:hypothetical protein